MSSAASSNKRQFSLGTLLLLILAVATWLTFIRFQRMFPELRSVVTRMETLIPDELQIDDPTQVAAVRLRPTWYDENIWELYLPDGYEFQLRLATHDVGGEGLAPPMQFAKLSSGRHRVELESTEKVEDEWNTELLINGQSMIVAKEALAWNEGHGSSGGSTFTQDQFAPEGDTILFRRRWAKQVSPNSYKTPDGPCPGLLVWIHGAKSESRAPI